MTGAEVVQILKDYQPALRARGVSHAALFGSRARGDYGPDSDIDIAIEIDPAAPVTIFDYVAIKVYIAGLFRSPVDVVERSSLKRYSRVPALPVMIDAF